MEVRRQGVSDFRLKGVFLKKTHDAVAEVTDTYLALIPEKGGQVRVTHYNGRHKSFTKYIGEALEPYVMKMNWTKYHDPIVHFILMRDKISLFETTALGQSGTHPRCSRWSKVADTEEEWRRNEVALWVILRSRTTLPMEVPVQLRAISSYAPGLLYRRAAL